MISDSGKKNLLLLARRAIESIIKGSNPPELDLYEPIFDEIHGAFVTLYLHNELKGCIGNINGKSTLKEDISELAVASATRDHRFKPVSADEVEDIHIEISVLSPLEEVKDTSEIVIGEHGLIIESGFNRGVLLPQVSVEENWDTITFLQFTCQKAGLSTDDWKLRNTKIYRFTTFRFSESEE